MERFEQLCHALNSLPDAQGQRVFEHSLLNHSVKAIAAAEGVTERAINAAFQTHATGFEDAGSTMYAGVDMAFQLGKTRHGVGAMFVNDVFGLFSQKSFAVQYAYHLKLWGGVFSLGTQLDLLSETIHGIIIKVL